MRSWLAGARHINDLGTFTFVPELKDPQEQAEVDRRFNARWDENCQRPLPAKCRDHDYFGSRMHDSIVLEISRTDSHFTMHVSSQRARFFAQCLESQLGIPPRELDWPVDLIVSNPVFVRACRIDGGGWLHHESYVFLRRMTFLYDHFFEEDGRIQWIVNLWHGPWSQNRLGANIYLAIDGEEAYAVDRTAEVMRETYGDVAAELWRQLPAEEWDFETYISARLGAH